MTEEVAERLIDPAGLPTLADSCTEAILPPPRPPVAARTSAVAMTGEPGWAHCTVGEVGNDNNCVAEVLADDAVYFLYAPTPSVSTNVELDTAGRYELRLRVSADVQPALSLTIDDVPVDSWVVAGDGDETLATVVELDAGNHALSWTFDFSQADGQDFIHVLEQFVEGPLDEGAEVHAEARETCVRDAMEALAAGAFRRPITAAEQTRVAELYATGVELDGFHSGLEMVVGWIFRSPYFAYLVELGALDEAEDDRIPLTSWELAARLSYTLCEGPPDAELRAHAADGTIREGEVLAAEAARLLDADCGRATVTRFYEQWLGVDALDELARDPEVYPEFTPQMPQAMLAETRRYVRELTFERDATVAELLTARESWIDPILAPVYDIEIAGEGPSLVELPDERAGLLTQASVLTVTSKFEQTSPVHRGVFVLEELLCGELPSPPEDVDITPPALDPSLTTRERWAAHSADPSCAACHELMDPVGFALEEFDAIGRHRTTENGKPIDASGGIPWIGIPDGEVEGGRELVETLAMAPDSSACFARQWSRFARARLEDHDDPEIAALEQLAADAPIRELLLALVTSESFRYRLLPEDN